MTLPVGLATLHGRYLTQWNLVMAGTVITVNGFVNSTTDDIYGPLVSDNTSIAKTIAYRLHSTRFYKGETWVGNVRYSGDRESLQTFSAEHTLTGAVTRTSVVGT